MKPNEQVFRNLSTPSFGITREGTVVSNRSLFYSTFNSLFRDHPICHRHHSVGAGFTFQLPLSGSLRKLLGSDYSLLSIKKTFNSLFRDHETRVPAAFRHSIILSTPSFGITG